MSIHHLVLPDDAGATRHLLDRSDPAGRLLVVQARPDTRHVGWLARAMLAVMGQDLARDTTSRVASEDVSRCQAWLTGHGIEHVVLVDGQVLRPGVINELVPLLDHAGCNLWLADHLPISDRHHEHVAALDAAEVDLDQLPAPVGPYENTEVERRLLTPAVPQAHFAHFRAIAQRQLDPGAFAMVDELYRSAFVKIEQTVGQGSDLSLVASRLLQQAPDAHGRVVVARAAQAAAFLAGYELLVDLEQLDLDRAHPDAAIGQRGLVRYADPQRALVCLLSLLGVTPEEQLALRLENTAEDGGDIGGIEIPRWARVVVRAHRSRRMQEVDDESPLFASPRGGPWTTRAIRRIVNEAATDLGVGLDAARTARKGRAPDTRLLGVRLEVIA